MNENDYGKFKLVELERFSFHSIPYEDYFINSKEEKIKFPYGYLGMLEKHIELI